jgi:hypothetical protein
MAAGLLEVIVLNRGRRPLGAFTPAASFHRTFARQFAAERASGPRGSLRLVETMSPQRPQLNPHDARMAASMMSSALRILATTLRALFLGALIVIIRSAPVPGGALGVRRTGRKPHSTPPG